MSNRKDAGHVFDRLGVASAVVATIAWGMTGPFVHMMTTATAGMITVGRLSVAAILLWAVDSVRRKPSATALHPTKAVVAMAAYYVLATEAFTRAPVVEVTLLVGSSPLIAVTMDRLAGRRVGRLRLFGVIVAIVGLAAFVLPGRGLKSASTVGDLLALGAAVVSALYVTQLRSYALRRLATDPIGIAMRASLIGATVATVLAMVRGTWIPQAISSHDWLIVTMLGALSTAVPTVAFGIASRRLPASVTTSLSLLTPFFAAVFAGVLLGEWPALAHLPGGALAIVGIAIVVASK